MKKIEKFNFNPLGSDPGLAESIGDSGATPRDSLVDIGQNPLLGQPGSSEHPENRHQFYMSFDSTSEEIGDSKVLKFERWESGNSGLGMTKDILENQYFHTPLKKDQKEKKGAGVWGIGETRTFRVLTRTNPDLRELGWEVITKTKEMDKFIRVKYNPDTAEVMESGTFTYDEGIKAGYPVDKIGDTRGTYSMYYIDTQDWEDDWLQNLRNDIGSVMGDSIRESVDYYIKGEFDNIFGGLSASEEEPIQDRIIPRKGSSQKRTLDFFGKDYEVEVYERPKISPPDTFYEEFKQKYGENRSALKGLDWGDGLLKENNVIILKDGNQWYSYHYILSNGHTPRLVMEITIDKKDISTDWQKRRALLHNSVGKPIGKSQATKVFNKMFDELFPVNKVVEEQLRDQLYDILVGNQWPESFINSPTLYDTLYQELNLPPEKHEDFKWFEENLIREYFINPFNRKIDLYIKEIDWVGEVKPKEPDSDSDWHQVMSYFGLVEPKIVNTIAVSQEPKSRKDRGFSKKSKEDFEILPNLEPPTNKAKWKLFDLRHYGLHELHKKFIKPE
tara:strand:+ start:151 stop:1827 length:1677 start_codon:yes stop_codon:yes gene_type:complete